MLKNKFLSFLLFALVTFSASTIGGLATVGFKEPWYSLIIKPSFNPPDWIFAPVWTTLYFFMTIAIWKFWHSKNRNLSTVYLYFIHILFNTTWSIVFFWVTSNITSSVCFNWFNINDNNSHVEI